MSAKPIGTFCWADLLPQDQPRAEAFYAALAGWTSGGGHPDFGNYAMQFLGEQDPSRTAAGIAGAMDEAPPMWNLYLSTPDFAATAAAVEAAGGQSAMPPFEIPGSGKGGFFLDPTGAVFGVWESWGHDGFGDWDNPGKTGTFVWSEVYTRDGAAAADFFATVFGLEKTPLSETTDFTYYLLGAPGEPGPRFGVMQMGDSFPFDVQPGFLVYLSVDDADASAAQVRELGGEVIRDPWDTPHGHMCLIKDTEGALLCLVNVARKQETI